MKNVNLIILFVATLFFGCGKEKLQPESLIGKWELRRVLGGQIADAPSHYEKGNGNIIEFSALEYHRIDDGMVVSKRHYEIVEESAEIDGTEFTNRIVFDDTDQKVFINLSGNKLLICLGPIAADGTTSAYEKM